MLKTGVLEFEELFFLRDEPSEFNNIDILKTKDIMDDKFYSIPKYQREYKWNKELVETLIKDVKENNSELFGVLHLNYNANEKKIEIIDGQQRITTLILLIIELINNLRNQGEEYNSNNYMNKYKFENNYNNENLPNLIKKNNGEYELDFSEDFLLQKNQINEVKGVIETKIQNENKTDIINILNKIDKLKFIVVMSESRSSSISPEKIFLDINEKGLHLDGEDILKAKIFSMILDEEKSTQIKDLWSEIKICFIKVDSHFNGDIIKSAHNQKNIVGSLISRYLKVFDHSKNYAKRDKFKNEIKEDLKIKNTHYIDLNDMVLGDMETLLNNVLEIVKNSNEKIELLELKDFVMCEKEEKILKYLWNSSSGTGMNLFLIILLFENRNNQLNGLNKILKLLLFRVIVEAKIINKVKMLEVFYFNIIENEEIKQSNILNYVKNQELTFEIKNSQMWKILDLIEINGTQLDISSNFNYFISNFLYGNLTEEHFLVMKKLDFSFIDQTSEEVSFKFKGDKVSIKREEDIIEIPNILNEVNEMRSFINKASNKFYIDSNLNNNILKDFFFLEKIELLKNEFSVPGIPNSISIILDKIKDTPELDNLSDSFGLLKQEFNEENIKSFLFKYLSFCRKYFEEEINYKEKLDEILNISYTN